MRDFSSSTAGRLMTLSLGVALTGGGVAAVIHSSASVPVMSFSLFVPVVMNIVGLPQALEEHWFQAVLSAILLPFGLFSYAVGAAVLAAYRPDAGYALIALGLGAFALALRGAQAREPAEVHLTQQHS